MAHPCLLWLSLTRFFIIFCKVSKTRPTYVFIQTWPVKLKHLLIIHCSWRTYFLIIVKAQLFEIEKHSLIWGLIILGVYCFSIYLILSQQAPHWLVLHCTALIFIGSPYVFELGIANFGFHSFVMFKSFDEEHVSSCHWGLVLLLVPSSLR